MNYIINEDEDVQGRPAAQSATISKFERVAIEDSHNTASFENQMLSCIEHGRPDLLKPMLETAALNQYTTGVISTDSLRAHKNILVTSITLASRAAIKGGLDYNLAMQISDKYLQQVENIHSFDGFFQLWTQMLLDYASRTANLQLCVETSPLVRAVAQQVNGQLYQKITVEQLAQSQNVSRSYLSHQFTRETGKKLTDYIAEQKINEAIRLMQTTDIALAEIAYLLAFSSQSYFHATFKRITGINPGKYPRNRG